ncbi:MAG: DUF177 domain-containing protein [Burkholderiaceae bacterium]
MTSVPFDPSRLPVARFAAESRELGGDWAIAELARLAASECVPDAGSAVASRAAADLSRRVRWHVVGSLRSVGGQPQIWLALTADADVVLQCQRCLSPLDETVRVDRRFRFVDDEATAAALDDEMEDDALALSPTLDLRELVEDEMLLALPLVPRHAQCPQPLPTSFGDVEIVGSPAARPFAALAALRKESGGGDGG